MSISSLVNFAIVVSAFIISVLGLLFTFFRGTGAVEN